MIVPINDHVEQALARLITQYKNAPVLQGIISSFVEQVQVIEVVLQQMNTLRYLDQATGQQLDNIGQIVGIARKPGESDDDYRNDIKGQIKINSSDGQPEQIIQLYQLLTNAQLILLDEGDDASIQIESEYVIPDQATADKLITILMSAMAAGVRLDWLVQFDPDIAFAYDGNLPGFGYDDGSQTVGGKYAALWFFVGGGFAYDGDDAAGLGYGSYEDPLCGGVYLT